MMELRKPRRGARGPGPRFPRLGAQPGRVGSAATRNAGAVESATGKSSGEAAREPPRLGAFRRSPDVPLLCRHGNTAVDESMRLSRQTK